MSSPTGFAEQRLENLNDGHPDPVASIGGCKSLQAATRK